MFHTHIVNWSTFLVQKSAKKKISIFFIISDGVDFDFDFDSDDGVCLPPLYLETETAAGAAARVVSSLP